MLSLCDADAELLDHGKQHAVLIFQMAKDGPDLSLSFHVHFQIMLRTQLSMAALNILPDHYEWHEQDLDNI